MGGNEILNLVVYGSLMKRAERRRAGFSPLAALPVRVDGFRRVFDQIASWRKGRGENVAVLEARRDPASRMNAVLLLDVAGCLAAADHRERGYERCRIPRESIVGHDNGEPVSAEGDTFIYVGKPDRRARGVLPNLEYLRICMEGAREQGQGFYEDFLKTTFLCDGRTLRAEAGRRSVTSPLEVAGTGRRPSSRVSSEDIPSEDKKCAPSSLFKGWPGAPE